MYENSVCLSQFNERLNMSEILISFNLSSVLLVWLSETLSRPSNFALQSVSVIIKQDNKIHEYPHRYMFAGTGQSMSSVYIIFRLNFKQINIFN